jgi:hypothetical protein
MGKVSTAFISIGLVFLLPAIALTVIPLIAPMVTQNLSNLAFDWFSGFVRAIVLGVLYVVAFGFTVLGVIILKRDSE